MSLAILTLNVGGLEEHFCSVSWPLNIGLIVGRFLQPGSGGGLDHSNSVFPGGSLLILSHSSWVLTILMVGEGRYSGSWTAYIESKLTLPSFALRNNLWSFEINVLKVHQTSGKAL